MFEDEPDTFTPITSNEIEVSDRARVIGKDPDPCPEINAYGYTRLDRDEEWEEYKVQIKSVTVITATSNESGDRSLEVEANGRTVYMEINDVRICDYTDYNMLPHVLKILRVHMLLEDLADV